MAVKAFWAGATSSSLSNWTVANNMLPSPVSVDVTREQIWNADAGRGANGNMDATYIASKRTYNIKWGVLSSSEFSQVTTLLTTDKFSFGEGTSTTKPSSVSTYYRSEIAYSFLQADDDVYYKDVAVSVIQW